MSGAAGKRNKAQLSTALITPVPISDFPLYDALDKATRERLNKKDSKLLKCDFSRPTTFRIATGGARALLNAKLDPPPNVYASEPD